MRYRLRTLHVLLAIGPPLLAVAFWSAQFFWSYPAALIGVALAAAAIFGLAAWYRELDEMICGPHLRPRRRKSRRVVRFRIERYSGSSPTSS